MTESPLESYMHKKRILVIGGCGTVGRDLVRQLLEEHAIEELIVLDNNESELFFLEQQFSSHAYARFFLGDVRDVNKLSRLMENIDIVFHTAAFKHVILCERSPMEAVQTNIVGVQNVILAARENEIQRVIFTSSDKAVNPTNVMGTSKLMGERLMTAANSNSRGNGQLFASTRFGNVLGSRGSVIPIFREQIRRGGPVTLTDPGMTRFIMSIKEAVRLVIDSVSLMQGGEVFVTKMPVIRIKDLAEIMIAELAPTYGYNEKAIDLNIIGTKPGEKMYEELMNFEETRRSVELPRYFSVLPAFKSLYHTIDYNYPEIVSEQVNIAYNSGQQTPLTPAELRAFLIENDLLQEDPQVCAHPKERYWP